MGDIKLISLQALNVFLTVADQGSFTKAGKILGLSQPAVSQIIQSLEEHFDDALFEREARGIGLTDAGAYLIPMARELLAMSMRLEENMDFAKDSVTGHFEIGCSTTLGKYLLPKLVANFCTHFPFVRIDILINSRKTQMNRLVSGDLAFAVSSKRIEHAALTYELFCEDPIVLIVSREHPWAKNGQVTCDDLLDTPLILREPTSGTYESLLNALFEQQILPEMLNVKMTVGNAEAIAMAVEENIGVGFVSQLVANRAAELGRVVKVGVDKLNPIHQVYFARNMEQIFKPCYVEFWQFLQGFRQDYIGS